MQRAMIASGKLDSSKEREPESHVLLILLVVLVSGCLALLLPFWPSLVLAIWTSFLTSPVVDRLTRAINGRRSAAALVTVGIVIAALTPVVAGLAVVVPDAIDLGQHALQSKSSSGALTVLVNGAGEGDQEATTQKLAELLQSHGQQAWTAASLLAGALGHFAIGLLIYLVATFAVMAQGREAYLWLRERLPIAPKKLDRLRDAFQETGKGLLYSVALTALLIASVATTAYASLGLPRPLALGVVTLIAALIPGIGPFLVWGPMALGLLLSGHAIKAAILVGVCLAVVTPIDHLVRPVLARYGKLQLNSFIVFLAMIGGIVSVGGWGLILGPLLYRMALEVISIVREPPGPAQSSDARDAPPRFKPAVR